MSGVNRGTTVILLIDFLVTMAVTTAGLLYLKMSPVYLLLLSSVSFALFFIVAALLSASDKQATSR